MINGDEVKWQLLAESTDVFHKNEYIGLLQLHCLHSIKNSIENLYKFITNSHTCKIDYRCTVYNACAWSNIDPTVAL